MAQIQRLQSQEEGGNQSAGSLSIALGGEDSTISRPEIAEINEAHRSSESHINCRSESRTVPFQVDSSAENNDSALIVQAVPVDNRSHIRDIGNDDIERNISESESTHCSSKLTRWLHCSFIFIMPVLLFMIRFLLFCIIPLTLLLLLWTGVYYCCTHDTEASWSLWNFLWQEEEGTASTDSETVANTAKDKSVTLSSDDIRNKLVRRRLLERRQNTQLAAQVTIQNVSGTDNTKWIVRNARETLIFSAPLSDQVDECEYNRCNQSSYCRSSKELHDQNGEDAPVDDDGLEDYCLGTICTICLRCFVPNDVVACSHNPSCNHLYHELCISGWLARKSTCPSCRQEYLWP